MSWLLIICSSTISFLSRPNVASMLKKFFNSISNEQIYSWLFTRAIQALINARAHQTAVSRIGLICDFTTQVIRFMAPLEQIVRYIIYSRELPLKPGGWLYSVESIILLQMKKKMWFQFLHSFSNRKSNLNYIIYKSNIYCQ